MVRSGQECRVWEIEISEEEGRVGVRRGCDRTVEDQKVGVGTSFVCN